MFTQNFDTFHTGRAVWHVEQLWRNNSKVRKSHAFSKYVNKFFPQAYTSSYPTSGGAPRTCRRGLGGGGGAQPLPPPQDSILLFFQLDISKIAGHWNGCSSRISRFTGYIRVFGPSVFSDSQVLRMVAFAVFPESQVFRMAGFQYLQVHKSSKRCVSWSRKLKNR